MTFYWYDLETFGRHPMLDRVAQFAGIRTDEQLNPVEEPLVMYCRITPDYVPDPKACLLTGITPQKTKKDGLREIEFFSAIHGQFIRPATCVAGYNNIRFDDEFIRNGFYRNFFDPYEREYANGNSRWDILDMLRAAHDLRPEGINWVRDEENKPVFRLEILTQANNIEHSEAHDALADVRATIAMASLVREKQPKLFRYLLQLRKKEEVWKYLDIFERTPVLHTSGMFTSEKGCTSMIMPVAVDPNNNNHIIAYDLRQPPEALLDSDQNELRRKVFTPQAALGEGEQRIPLKGIHVNRCPVLAPLSTLDKKQAQRLGIDIEKCLEHAQIIRKSENIARKIMDLYAENSFTPYADPDLQIYSGGFFSDRDREKMTSVRTSPPETLQNLNLQFDDPRIPEMIWRFIGRNYPANFSEEEQRRWKSFCAGRILFPPDNLINNFQFFKRKITEKINDKALSAKDKLILHDLQAYAEFLEKRILN